MRTAAKSVRVAATLVAAVTTLIAFSQQASASNCSNTGPSGTTHPGHYYSGEGTNPRIYAGIEGDVSVDSILIRGATFEINWIGAFGGGGCAHGVPAPTCSIQAGNGTGTVGGFASPAGLHGYMEEGDINGYVVNWTPGLSLTQNDYVSVFYDHTNTSSAGRWSAYITPAGQSPVLVGQAYFPIANGAYLNEQAEATSESYYTALTACSYIGNYQYYGTNGAGAVSAGTQLDTSLDGTSWSAITTDVFTFADYPYNYLQLSGSRGFRGWGA